MIIDDNAMMREFLNLYLARQFEVSSFDRAEDALASLQGGHHPDLILLDLNMPGISGYDFLGEIKKSEELKNINVIILSGVDKSEDRIRCLSMGASDFLVKPFNPQELTLRVNHQLQFAARQGG